MFRQSPIFSQNNALLNVKTGCSPDFAEKVQPLGRSVTVAANRNIANCCSNQ